jgi:hypothetical protein
LGATFIFLSIHLQMRSSIKTTRFLGLFPPLIMSATRAEIARDVTLGLLRTVLFQA